MVSTGSLIIRFLLVAVVLFMLDYYAFQGIKTATLRFSERSRTLIQYSYWIFSMGIILAGTLGFLAARAEIISFPFVMKIVGILFTALVTKLVLIFFLAGEDSYRILLGSGKWIARFFSEKPGTDLMDSRRQFISQIGLGVAAIPMVGMIYGMVKGKYDFVVKKETLFFTDLPEAFDGFTITQISDIHSGSFDSRGGVLQGLNLVKDLKSDLLVFTGDLVNNTADEVVPWLEDLTALHAPFGKYSILGNHDYGDYISWDSPEAKENNFKDLLKHHSSMGFRLLMNEGLKIEKDGQHFSLLGVENWGHGFNKKGDLRLALRDSGKDDFKILLSHDPSHWEEEVMGKDHNIHLTLSGHTHGMQFGVEIGNFKWSPVKYRYPRWAGLYTEYGSHLYVNRGFGFLGYPGRIGIWPEITQITLRKK